MVEIFIFFFGTDIDTSVLGIVSSNHCPSQRLPATKSQVRVREMVLLLSAVSWLA